jgi:hypothetical protein
MHHTVQIRGWREFVLGTSRSDPMVEIAHAPVVGGDRIGPISVAPIKQREISPTNGPVLRNVETVAAADILCRIFSDLPREKDPAFRAPAPGGAGSAP